MKERPILFSAPMVLAIIEGRKLMTRRIVKPQPGPDGSWDFAWHIPKRFGCTPGTNIAWRKDQKPSTSLAWYCPYGAPGDRLWVRETLIRPDGDPWLYRADNQPVMVDKADETAMLTWAHHKQQDVCVSIHMPRWASRITLEVADVRVERLNEISEEDARAEGCIPELITAKDTASIKDPKLRELSRAFEGGSFSAKFEFQFLWESIHGADSWALNPWLWCVSFRRVDADPMRSEMAKVEGGWK